MSKVFNMVTGGGGGTPTSDTTMLYALGYAGNGIEAAAFTNGVVTVRDLDSVSFSTVANAATYAYIRLGPMSFNGMSRIKALVSVSNSIANGTRRVVLFASQANDAWSQSPGVITGAEGTSPNEENGVSIVNSSSDLNKVKLYLDVSNYQTGSYYLYCGIDTTGAAWTAVRNGELYGINYDPIT